MTESEIVATLRERMRWYRDGCPDLEDTPVYFASGDCARDAASDLATALDEIERLTKGAPARAAEWQPLLSDLVAAVDASVDQGVVDGVRIIAAALALRNGIKASGEDGAAKC